MGLIKKWWVRLIISLILGGIIAEALIVTTSGEVNINAFILGIGIYLLSSVGYGLYLRSQKN